jgi:hypothetical protein
MEALGDHWGRAIRYRGDPHEPDKTERDFDGRTRRDLVREWIEIGDLLHPGAELENDLTSVKEDVRTVAEAARIAEVETRFEQAAARGKDGVLAGPAAGVKECAGQAPASARLKRRSVGDLFPRRRRPRVGAVRVEGWASCGHVSIFSDGERGGVVSTQRSWAPWRRIRTRIMGQDFGSRSVDLARLKPG